MKKQLLVAGIATAVGITGLTGVGIANAATTPNGPSQMTSLVDAIAGKFNLNKSDVQAVFDQQHAQMLAQRETEVKAQVAQLVTDGKLTQAQADKINAKRTELQKEREALRTADPAQTREQIRTEMQQKRTELETWAKDNGIDAQYLHYVMGGPGRGGMQGQGGMHGQGGMMRGGNANGIQQ